jgi:hypothetical protein
VAQHLSILGDDLHVSVPKIEVSESIDLDGSGMILERVQWPLYHPEHTKEFIASRFSVQADWQHQRILSQRAASRVPDTKSLDRGSTTIEDVLDGHVVSFLFAAMCGFSVFTVPRGVYARARFAKVWPGTTTLLVCAAAMILLSGASAAKLRKIWRQPGYNSWSEDRPTGRWSHATVKGPDGSVYLYGGLRDGSLSDELFQLNVDTGEWHDIQPLGTVRPNARCFHAMSAVGTDLYLSGGVTEGEGGWRWRGEGRWCWSLVCPHTG